MPLVADRQISTRSRAFWQRLFQRALHPNEASSFFPCFDTFMVFCFGGHCFASANLVTAVIWIALDWISGDVVRIEVEFIFGEKKKLYRPDLNAGPLIDNPVSLPLLVQLL